MNKTKEQIREFHLRQNGLSVNKSKIGDAIQKAAFDAMDEWAEIEAIEFAVWLKDFDSKIENLSFYLTSFNNIETGLYQLYQKDKNNK